MYEGKLIAVVVPAYNEEELVGRTIETLPGWVDLVVVVDDGSEDSTRDAAVAAARGRPGFEVLRHPENRGVGAAIVTGYRRALELGAQVVVVMGGDAQMDPLDLPALLGPVVRGEADYAKGNRLVWPGVRRVMPRVRWVGNWILTVLTRVVSGYWTVTDSQCGYTAISAHTVSSLPLERLYPRYGYPNDLLSWLNVMGCRVVDVPVRPIYASERSGIRVGRVAPRLLWLLARSMLRRLWLNARAREPRGAGKPQNQEVS